MVVAGDDICGIVAKIGGGRQSINLDGFGRSVEFGDPPGMYSTVPADVFGINGAISSLALA